LVASFFALCAPHFAAHALFRAGRCQSAATNARASAGFATGCHHAQMSLSRRRGSCVRGDDVNFCAPLCGNTPRVDLDQAARIAQVTTLALMFSNDSLFAWVGLLTALMIMLIVAP